MKFIRYHNSPVYNPVTNYTSLREDLDRLFDAAFPSLQGNGFFDEGARQFPVDLYQERDAFIVRAELPGFRKEDISLEVADGILTVTGHQKTETKSGTKEKDATVQEQRVSREISLPEHLKLDQITASYENGILTITLPKSEEVKPKQIAIEVK